MIPAKLVFGRSPFGLTQVAAVRLPDHFLDVSPNACNSAQGGRIGGN
jgi:hypothetical protein